MTLVDFQIHSLAKNGMIAPYDVSSLTGIGYDLTVKEMYIDMYREKNTFARFKEFDRLSQGDSVMVSCNEILTLPPDICARIVPRNSAIRMGLTVDAPIYQPGHRTRVFFRLTCLDGPYHFRAGDSLATMVFERLNRVPQAPYNGKYQEELDYKGVL